MGEYAELEIERELFGELERAYIRVDYSTWVCRDGTKIKVVDMPDSHLDNTIRMLLRNGKASNWLFYLQREKETRKGRMSSDGTFKKES